MVSITLALALLQVVCAVPMRTVVTKSTPSNSGTIPGTNITVYGLMDPRTGKPMDFNDLVDNILPSSPHTDSNQLNKRGVWDESQKIRRLCIPQLSTHPLANPYHEDLMGLKDVNYLKGAGRPMIFPNAGADCPVDTPGACTIVIANEITYQNAIAYSVSDSQSNSVTKNVGGSSSQTDSSSVSDTVSHTIEKTWSEADTHTTEESVSHTTGSVITEGWNKGSNNISVGGIGGDHSNGSTSSHEDNGNWHVDASATVGWSGGSIFGGPTVSGTVGGGHGEGWSNSNGKNTQDSVNWNVGFNNGKSQEDNYSKQTQDLTTGTTGSSDSHTSTTGGSNSDTNSHMTTKGVEFTTSKDWSHSDGSETGTGSQNTTTSTNIITTSFTYTFPVPPGACRKAACFPNAEMYIVPFLCGDSQTQTAERVYASVAKLEQKNAVIGCFTIGLIDCDDASNNVMPFVTYDKVIRGIGEKNVLRVGGLLDTSNGLVSNNGLYTAVVEKTGNFIVWRSGTIKVWESGATPFIASDVTKYRHRMRINMRGHLVIETANMWSKVTPPWQRDVFVESWSTQPVYRNYTVGSPRRPDSAVDDYMLVLDDKGGLFLYDAAYVVIWCTLSTSDRPCPTSKGFKYQEEYLLPTDFPTPDPGLGPDKDPQNSLLDNPTLYMDKSFIVSQDVNCTDFVNSGTGIVSPNGRFKVILTKGGELMIKDGTRTMWSSYTNNFDGSSGPYHLSLTFEGDLVIIDSYSRWIWYAKNEMSRTSGPYKASITDGGKFVVTDKAGVDMWESWPQRNLNGAMRVYDKFVICYKGCNECKNPTETLHYTHTSTSILPTKTVQGSGSLDYTTTTLVQKPTNMANAYVNDVKETMAGVCKRLAQKYNVIPFVNLGSPSTVGNWPGERELDEWYYYKCDCIWSNMYGEGTYIFPDIKDGKTWGKITDTNARKKYLSERCGCYVNMLYNTQLPMNWGFQVGDLVAQKGWNDTKCDTYGNVEPFVRYPDDGKSHALVVTESWDMVKTARTNVATSTTVNVETATSTTRFASGNIYYTYSMIDTITRVTLAATASVTPNPIDMYSVYYRPTPTMPPYTGPGPTTPPTSGCSGGKPGKGDGSGKSGQCCKVSNDCQETCKSGMCGTCGKDFSC